MRFGEKIERLREEKGWSMPQIAEMIGTNTSQWQRWADDDYEPFDLLPDKHVILKPPSARKGKKGADGGGNPATPKARKTQGTYPSRISLVRLAEAFDVDVAWLIDDRKGWADRPKLGGPLLDRFKRLTPEQALRMFELWAGAATLDRKPNPSRN